VYVLFLDVLELEKISSSTVKISPQPKIQWAITEELIIAKLAPLPEIFMVLPLEKWLKCHWRKNILKGE
jgi:hypothetical protein